MAKLKQCSDKQGKAVVEMMREFYSYAPLYSEPRNHKTYRRMKWSLTADDAATIHRKLTHFEIPHTHMLGHQHPTHTFMSKPPAIVIHTRYEFTAAAVPNKAPRKKRKAPFVTCKHCGGRGFIVE